MDDNFLSNFMEYLSGDISRFSVEFSVFIITFVFVAFLVTLFFPRGKEQNYEDLRNSKTNKTMKKVLK